MNILVVCTANQCRSPMAEVLLREALRRRRVVAAVGSAGLGAQGHAAAAEARRVVAERGLTLEGHRSRTLTAELLRAADLVLTMERRHVQSAVVLEPACWPVCFPVLDVVRRAERLGARAAHVDLADWSAALHAGRRLSDMVGGDGADDVVDPMGGPARGYRAVADRLETLVDRFVDLAFPELPRPAAPGTQARLWAGEPGGDA